LERFLWSLFLKAFRFENQKVALTNSSELDYNFLGLASSGRFSSKRSALKIKKLPLQIQASLI
jgi:hypothetical protein